MKQQSSSSGTQNQAWWKNPVTRSVIWFVLGFVALFGITSSLIVMERGSLGIDRQEGLLTEMDQVMIEQTLAKYIEATSA